MVGRSRFSSWLIGLCVLAVFAAEPAASVAFGVELFRAVGEFGGAVVVEVTSSDDGAVR
jgi:hypothetical protein